MRFMRLDTGGAVVASVRRRREGAPGVDRKLILCERRAPAASEVDDVRRAPEVCRDGAGRGRGEEDDVVAARGAGGVGDSLPALFAARGVGRRVARLDEREAAQRLVEVLAPGAVAARLLAEREPHLGRSHESRRARGVVRPLEARARVAGPRVREVRARVARAARPRPELGLKDDAERRRLPVDVAHVVVRLVSARMPVVARAAQRSLHCPRHRQKAQLGARPSASVDDDLPSRARGRRRSEEAERER